MKIKVKITFCQWSLKNFKHRHGIRELRESREMYFADVNAAKHYLMTSSVSMVSEQIKFITFTDKNIGRNRRKKF